MTEQTGRISTPTDDRQLPIFRDGDQVEIVVRGHVDRVYAGDLILDLGDGKLAVIPLDAEDAITITQVVPDWWPPKPGQIVRVRNHLSDAVLARWVTERSDGLWFLDEHGIPSDAELAVQKWMVAGCSLELISLVSARLTTGGDCCDPIEDADRCGATGFSEPHGYVQITDAERQAAEDDCWELCGRPAFDDIHRAPTCGACGADTWSASGEVAHKRDCPYLVAAALDEQDGGGPR